MAIFSDQLGLLAAHQVALELPVDQASVNTSLPVPNPTKSFWVDTPGCNPHATDGSDGPLTDDADICIIGSGITGVAAAYHLAKAFEDSHSLDRPVKTVILEAREFCSGATGRNGGHLTPAAFAKFREGAHKFGVDEALRGLALEHHTVSSIVQIVTEHNKAAAVDLVEGGHIDLQFTDEEVVEVRADYDAAREAGADLDGVTWLTEKEMHVQYGAVFPGVRIPGYNIWPLKLVSLLFELAHTSVQEVALHTRTPVTAISPIAAHPHGPRARRWALATPRGTVKCTHVLHATNAYAPHLLPHLRGPNGIIPARGQIIATRASAELTHTGFGNGGFEYWFPRPLGPGEEHALFILGGGREAMKGKFELYELDDGKVNPAVGDALRVFLPEVFPGKFEVGREPEIEWTGIMGFTKSHDPFVGPVVGPPGNSSDTYKGQYISAGYTGHGMPRAFACGEVVAQMIASEYTGKKWALPEWLPKHFLTTPAGNE